MRGTILIEEFHLAIRAPPRTPATQCDAIAHALNKKRFQAGLGRVVRQLCRRYPVLSKVRIVISR